MTLICPSEIVPTVTGQEVARVLHMSYANFRDRYSKQPGFPKPIRTGVWLLRDINQWMERKAA